MPVTFFALIAVATTLYTNTSTTSTIPIAAQRGASTYLRPWLISHKRGLGGRAVLHEDEHRRDHRDRSAENPEHDLCELDPFGLALELDRQEPVHRADEAHEQPDDHGVDVQHLGDAEIQLVQQEAVLQVVEWPKAGRRPP